uniref:hypothetical protein n=1 Tax=Alloprevotella sp. TaxID=1872471 RepID=UPI004024EB95
MKKNFFIFCLMFWAFAAGAYSQYIAGKVAGAVVKAVRAAGNIKPPVVPPVPPAIPQQVHAFPKIDTPSVPIDTSSVSYAIPPAISSVKPPKERKTVSLLENDMPPWGWLLVAVIVILGVYTYGCCRSTEKEKEAQRRQEAARKPEEKREDKKSSAAPETQPRRQPSPKAPSAAKNEKPSGILYVDSKGVVRKKIEEE